MSDWREQAACRGVDPEVFHPGRGSAASETDAALAMCAVCPVVEQCLAYALNTNQKLGIWGGTTGRDRRQLIRTWRRTTPCNRCGTRLEYTSNAPKYCDRCRKHARSESNNDYHRANVWDSKRCPVCTCEFTGGRDCCSPLCARVFRRRQVAS